MSGVTLMQMVQVSLIITTSCMYQAKFKAFAFNW